MLRVMIVLFWVSLLVGTLVAHSVVAKLGHYPGWPVLRRAMVRTAQIRPAHRHRAAVNLEYRTEDVRKRLPVDNLGNS